MTSGKLRPTDACGKWEPGEQKGGTLMGGGENLPSFKSLSDRVTLIGGSGEGVGWSGGGGHCTSMPQNISAPEI